MNPKILTDSFASNAHIARYQLSTDDESLNDFFNCMQNLTLSGITYFAVNLELKRDSISRSNNVFIWCLQTKYPLLNSIVGL